MNSVLRTTDSRNSVILYVGIAVILLFGVWGYCMRQGYRGGRILFQPWNGVYAIECFR